MNDIRFDGRVAVVTGAGRGLGREYALALAGRGARVVVNDLGSSDPLLGSGSAPEPATAVVEEIVSAGGEAVVDTHSVATAEGGRGVFDTAMSTWGRVDIVVNNAGIVGPVDASFADLSDAALDAVFGVQLMGPFNVLRPVWPQMIAQGYGRVLNISSCSVFGQGEACAYPAAKGAVIAMTKNLGMTGPEHGIRVNALMPIAFTRMVENMPEPARTWVQQTFPPPLAGPAAVFLVSEDVPCSGECFSTGGGRLARVFLGESVGISTAELTVEYIREHFAEVMDPSGFRIPANTAEELMLYAELLAAQ